MSYQVLRESDPPAYALGDEAKTETSEGNPPPAPAPAPPAPAPTLTAVPTGYMYVPTNQQQQTHTATVVACQPHALPQVAVTEPRPRAQPAVLILSLVLAILCGLHLFLPAFVCVTPALIFAIVGYSLSDSPHQKNTAKAFNGVSLCCNIATIIFYVLTLLAAVITVAVFVGISRSTGGGCYSHCSPNYYYNEGYDYESVAQSCESYCY